MEFFDKYTSNTCAGTSNQYYFSTDGEIRTGRIFYKISVSGEYDYSVMFSNILDSTYGEGNKNQICDGWDIKSARIGRCKEFPVGENVEKADLSDIAVSDFRGITFNGKSEKEVMPGEFFNSDPVEMYFEKGDYLCLEITFSGEMIPYHHENLLPVYVKDGDKWEYSKNMPVAGMIGCDRKVKGKVVFWGDSITQGIGPALNSYAHWCAVLSEMIGEDYSYWNIGIGCGRAEDAASCGAWLYKAMQGDIVFVCFGINDIWHGRSEEQIKEDLLCIVTKLKKAGKTVVLQTMPPFDFTDEKKQKWENVNNYIKSELKEYADIVFDNSEILGEENDKSVAKYDGHPNGEGCKIWAESLYENVKDLFYYHP